ncbi:MAG: Ig-like domain-containing protein [Planctomycetes bacterium]|nr:Ig-like domain-containing protein [Planctomycetota bacterium]
MGRASWALALACGALATACGGGGGGAGNSGSGDTGDATLATLRLLSHQPADDAVQVALDATIELTFDRVMTLDCFDSEDTWLRVAGSDTNVAGTFALVAGGSTVRFTPATPLARETDWEFQVGPLTCDRDGRILEVTESFTFRTLDETPPAVASSDVVAGQTGRSRTDALTVTFTEAIAPGSIGTTNVLLRDSFGTSWPCSRTVDGATLVVQPLVDLAGDRLFTLILGSSVRDRAGNALGSTWSVSFRAAADLAAPSVTGHWPDAGATEVSPLVQPMFVFDESMDPFTVEPSSLLFQDEFGSLVAFAIATSPDQRTLRIVPSSPLQQNRDYSLAFLLGPAAATDVSGNGLGSTRLLQFTTGTDTTAPTIVGAEPAAGSRRVSPNTRPTVTFSEALDGDHVTDATVTLTVDGQAVAAVVESINGTIVRLSPVLPLPVGADCELRLRGSHGGLRDLAGIPLAADLVATFTVSDDASTPIATLLPADGAANVAANTSIRVQFDSAMDSTTLTTTTVLLLDDADQPVPVDLTVHGSQRSVRLVPQAALQPGSYYRTVVRGGANGVRETTGNWLPEDAGARFRVGTGTDLSAPTVQLTVNGIDDTRLPGLCLPPSGFSIDLRATDGVDGAQDPSSVVFEFSGPGTSPANDTLLASATLGWTSVNLRLPASQPLAAGTWTLRALVADLSGNVGTSSTLSFTIAAATGDLLPFERTQVVWPRTDLDRDANGTSDFDDDMLRLGLMTSGDPAGTNTRMRRLLLDAILAQANRLLGRGDRGELLGADSVPLRFVRAEPRGVPHMQIALGGLDPEGSRTRRYGDPSTGVLGRAFYDHRNGNMADHNLATSPGLGVFPSEMWLYQSRIHRQVWPSFQTMFAQRFLSLCPDMGGTPAGADPLDSTVLAEWFDYQSAPSTQRARFNTILQALDDWSAVIGIILAHEVGHAVGLVAPGAAPTGLYGDASLHDTYSAAAEVMAATVGYESMITLAYRFRDIDLAYLRQRILLR